MADLSDDKLFKIINSMVNDKNEIINIHKLAEKFKIPTERSNEILFKYIFEFDHGNNLNNLIILFSADVEIEQTFNTILIPSYSESLDKILNNPSLLRLSIHSVQSKKSDFFIKDFSVYEHSLELRENATPIENSNNINISNSGRKSKGKEDITKHNDHVKDHGKDPMKEAVKDVKALKIEDNKQSKVVPANNTTKPKVESKNTKTNDIKASFSNMGKANNTNNTNITTNNTNKAAPSAHDKKQPKKKIIDDEDMIQEDPEEEFFYGGKPKNKNKNPDSNNEIDINSNHSLISSENTNETGKRKKVIDTEKSPRKIKQEFSKQQKMMNVEENDSNQNNKGNENGHIECNVSNNNSNNNNNDQNGHINENQPNEEIVGGVKKIKKIRKINVPKRYMDKDGYMQTVDEFVDEVYYVDENEVKPKNVNKPANNAVPEKNAKKGGKKDDKTQGSIMSFFGK